MKDKGPYLDASADSVRQIAKVAEGITVLRDGRHISTQPADQLTIDEVIRLMVGRQERSSAIRLRAGRRDHSPHEPAPGA